MLYFWAILKLFYIKLNCNSHCYQQFVIYWYILFISFYKSNIRYDIFKYFVIFESCLI